MESENSKYCDFFCTIQVSYKIRFKRTARLLAMLKVWFPIMLCPSNYGSYKAEAAILIINSNKYVVLASKF